MTNDVEHLFICSFAICISDEVTVTVFCPLFFLFLFLINSFLALLDFHCFVRAFSSWAEWLVCAWASCCGGFFCLGPWALGLRASVAVARGLSGCGFIAPWRVESRPEVRPASPALAERFLSTAPPAKSPETRRQFFWISPFYASVPTFFFFGLWILDGVA